MKRNLILIVLSVLMVALLLVGCSQPTTPTESQNADSTAAQNGETTEAQTEAQTGAQTGAPEGPIDLEALYEAGLAKINESQSEQPLVLLEETDPGFLNELFPGIADIDMAQSKFMLSPVTNGPVEVDFVEVKNAEDVQKVIDVFQARVDELSDDPTYPDNAEAWKNNSHITSRGNLVILAVLTDYYGEVPAEFILD